jgi:hypothetical protein
MSRSPVEIVDALPNPTTERFYQRRGLIGLGTDAHMEDLPYYEFSSAAAIAFLKEGE